MAEAAAGSPAPARIPATNAAWFARARRVIPGGVDSPVRSFASVGGTPYTVARGEGPTCGTWRTTATSIWSSPTVRCSSGTPIPWSSAALATAAAGGTTYGAPTRGEVLLAEAICGRVPGCEQVRLVSSGTEAAMSAVRVARGYTGS